MIFQSHAVNQLFPILSHHLLREKMNERERLFCLEAHEFGGQSVEPLALSSPRIETTWVRGLSAQSGLVSYFVKLDHFSRS